ncbi:MAG: hypothetical protein DMF59_01025 [Acidobacteria bacterium]|nr:MAG: hypothetical protein DMF59_01025 [Acidobacteriota bacterium]
MASPAVVEVDAGADGAAFLAASRTLSTQTWRALVPLARHGNESAAAGAGIMSATLDQSYAFCRKIAHQYGANFSVGFRFLPRQKRRAVYAAYAFCRWADDIADEDGGLKPAATLDDWQRELDRCYDGHPSHPITIALADALRYFNIPKSAFVALIEGCRQDLVKTRYANFDELLRYCELVAWSISDISLGRRARKKTRDGPAAHQRHSRHRRRSPSRSRVHPAG